MKISVRLRARGWLVLIALFAGAAVALALVASQQIGEDEVVWGSRPYTPEAPSALRVRTQLVQVGVVVRDANGKPVDGLTKKDFLIFDNGKPQVITNFNSEKSTTVSKVEVGGSVSEPGKQLNTGGADSAKRYIALYFDDTNTPPADFVAAKSAADAFLRHNLTPSDMIAVVTTSGSAEAGFTNDAAKLLEVITNLRPRYRQVVGPGGCPRLGIYQAHAILDLEDLEALEVGVAEGVQLGCLRDMTAPMRVWAVKGEARATLGVAEDVSQTTMDVLKDVMRFVGHMPGKRILVLTSSGFLVATTPVRLQKDKLVETALRNNVVINSLDARGLVADVPGVSPYGGPVSALLPGDGRISSVGPPDLGSYRDTLWQREREAMADPLNELAAATGGRFFHNRNDLGEGLRELAARPEVSYMMGFSPATLKLDGRYHEIKVKLAESSHYSVEARKGYFAPTPEKAGEKKAEDSRKSSIVPCRDPLRRPTLECK